MPENNRGHHAVEYPALQRAAPEDATDAQQLGSHIQQDPYNNQPCRRGRTRDDTSHARHQGERKRNSQIPGIECPTKISRFQTHRSRRLSSISEYIHTHIHTHTHTHVHTQVECAFRRAVFSLRTETPVSRRCLFYILWFNHTRIRAL